MGMTAVTFWLTRVFLMYLRSAPAPRRFSGPLPGLLLKSLNSGTIIRKPNYLLSAHIVAT